MQQPRLGNFRLDRNLIRFYSAGLYSGQCADLARYPPAPCAMAYLVRISRDESWLVGIFVSTVLTKNRSEVP